MQTDAAVVPVEVLARLQDTALFYPHSGSDLLVPIVRFSPYITDFWFSDIAYFRSDHQYGGGFSKCLSGDATKTLPLLSGGQSYEFQGSDIVGPPCTQIERRDAPDNSGQTYPYLVPCVRTETYLHRQSGKTIRIHLRRGYSVSAFRKEITTLGVFFYRGDSSEGSNTPWLSRLRRRPDQPGSGHYWLIEEVLERLVDGGLLVTDGSRCYGRSNPYRPLRQFAMRRNLNGQNLPEQVEPFVGPKGHEFVYMGYAGESYGPTLIWQVYKPRFVAASTAPAAVQPI